MLPTTVGCVNLHSFDFIHSQPETDPLRSWYVVARAMAHYRQGEYAEARTVLDSCFARYALGASHLGALARALAALIQHQLGDSAAARQSLQQPQATIAGQIPRPDQGKYFEGDWIDWLRALIFIREAERTLAGT